ncbi:mucin-22 [Ixodes scapularis]
MRTLTLCVCLLFVVLPNATASDGYEAAAVKSSTESTDGGVVTQTTTPAVVGNGATSIPSTKDEAGSISEGSSKDRAPSTPSTRSDPEKSTTVSKTDSASSATTPETTSTGTSEAPTSTESTPIPDRTTCSESKTNECRRTPFGKCEVLNGEDQCSCEPPMKLLGKKCKLEKKILVKVTFKVTKKSQTLYSNDDGCPSDEDIKTEIRQILEGKGVHITEISNIKCEGGEVTMDFEISDDGDNKIDENVKEALRNAQPTFGDFNIEGDGIDATLVDQCQNGLSQLGKKLGGLKCERKGNDYVLACDDTRSTYVESVDIEDIQVHMCQDKPCSEYCNVTQNKRCVREKCVCKHGFVPENDICVEACRPNICKNGGTCQPHSEVQFMCICPSKFKGLFCEEENKELHSAKLNIVIVGVVLSALLLLCFVVSASIISRMKKKNNLLAHDSKDKCVCKHGFVPENDICVEACRPNICKNGGTCQPHSEVQFMCICPSKFKGLFCEEENKELHSAKLNIVIVGVVLSALLLLCFVVSASIISRMKKKNNLLAHDSKDVERRRELHGYDGPYNANSSASKHRDHTSL